MHDFRVIVAVVMIHRLDNQTCTQNITITIQNTSEFFLKDSEVFLSSACPNIELVYHPCCTQCDVTSVGSVEGQQVEVQG